MSINEWVGGASARRMEVTVYVGEAGIGRVYYLNLNGKIVTYEVPATALSNDYNGYIDPAVRGLAAAIVSAAKNSTAIGSLSAVVNEGENSEAVSLTISGDSDGTPFTYDVGSGVVAETRELVRGVVGRNMRQTLALPGSPSGGTFTLTALGATTGAIAYNASAATVKTALEGLFVAGNVDVTGSAGGPWNVETKGIYARRDVDTVPVAGGSDLTGLITINATSVTQSSYGIVSRTITRGFGRKNERQILRAIGTFTAGKIKIGFPTSPAMAAVAYNANAATVESALEALADIGTGNVSVSGDFVTGMVIDFVEGLGGTPLDLLVAHSGTGGDTLTGGGLLDIIRTVEGGQTWGAGQNAVSPVKFVVAYSSPTNVASTIGGYVKDPLTGKKTPVVWSSTDTPEQIQAILGGMSGWAETDWYVSPQTNGVEISLIGPRASYSWSSEATASSSDGLFVVQRGATVSSVADVATTSTTTWQVSWRGFSGNVTLTGPSVTNPSAGASFTFAVADSITSIQSAINTASVALTVSEVTAGSGTGAGRVLKFVFKTLPGQSPHEPKALTGTLGSNSSTLVEVYRTKAGDVGTSTITELSYLGFPNGGTVTLVGPDGGTPTLTVGSEQTGLDAEYGAGNATVVRRDAATGAILVEWSGQPYRGLPLEPFTLTSQSLTGTMGISRVLERSRQDVLEEQEVDIANASGGTFTLTYSGQTTAGISPNATGAQVQTALEALSNLAPGDVLVYGDAGGPWRIVFLPTIGVASLITISSGSLTSDGDSTITSTLSQTATGPAHFMDDANWSLGRAPITGDTLVFRNSALSCLYDIEQPQITPARVTVYGSYTGAIGLPDYFDTDAVTLPKTLTLGTAGAGVLYLDIGVGAGDGPSLLRINTGGKQTEVASFLAGTSQDGSSIFHWEGTHASNKVKCYRGSMSIAEDGTAATVSELTVGWMDDRDASAKVIVGPNVTLSNVIQTGSNATIYCATTSIKQSGGKLRLDGTGAHTAIQIDGGTCEYCSSGTLGTATVASDGLLTFAGDMAPKTVTNEIDVYGDTADVNDENQVVSNLRIKYHRTSRSPNLGSNYQITRTLL